jgi:hypothetical protein
MQCSPYLVARALYALALHPRCTISIDAAWYTLFDRMTDAADVSAVLPIFAAYSRVAISDTFTNAIPHKWLQARFQSDQQQHSNADPPFVQLLALAQLAGRYSQANKPSHSESCGQSTSSSHWAISESSASILQVGIQLAQSMSVPAVNLQSGASCGPYSLPLQPERFVDRMRKCLEGDLKGLPIRQPLATLANGMDSWQGGGQPGHVSRNFCRGEEGEQRCQGLRTNTDGSRALKEVLFRVEELASGELKADPQRSAVLRTICQQLRGLI